MPSKDGGALSQNRQLTTDVKSYGSLSGLAADARSWFAVFTIPRHEKRVGELLVERGIETVLPLYRAARQWKKSRPVLLELPLFPCYLFVRTTRSALAPVLGVPGVVSIVGSAREAWPIPSADMEALRLGAQLGAFQPHPYLQIGRRVRIKAGLMTGAEGILVRQKNELRVVLTLEAIMKSVALEVNAEDLELLEQASPSLSLADAVVDVNTRERGQR